MSYDPIKISSITPLKDHVIVRDMNFNERQLNSGIILPSDNGRSSGIRPRWGCVYAVGPEQRDISIGQWILVTHGRWTRGSDIEINDEKITRRRVDVNDILLVSDEAPAADETMSDAR